MAPTDRSSQCGAGSQLVLVGILACWMPGPGHAEELHLQSLSFRERFSSQDLVGAYATERFKGHDLAATWALPWRSCSHEGLCADLRLIASAGFIEGGGDSALVVALTPVLALGTEDGRLSIDAGAGGALLSRHRFGKQDFGGPFQVSLTAGIGVPLYENLGAGYRYQHYSDAGIYGPGKVGIDMHMIELRYGL